jgi:hypothetical protein
VLVHLEKSEIPEDYAAMAIEIDGGQIASLSAANAGFIQSVTSGRVRLSADAFYREACRYPVLRVASVIVPRERNYVLFPEAAELDARVSWTEPFRFDRRLLAKAAKA